MPIQCHFDVKPVSKSQFYEVDHLVMHHAFEIQNELGRFYDEAIYQKELIRRCIKSGLSVISEGEIVVSYDSFRKSYFLDLFIDSGSIYELKAVDSLVGQHEAQLLNYLMLSDLRHGKLINFRPSSVQYRFVTSNLDVRKRMGFEVHDDNLLTDMPLSLVIKDVVSNLLAEWGSFLDINLYREALHHFLGRDNLLMQPVDVIFDGKIIGTQCLCLIDERTCLHVSSVIRHVESYKTHLLKMIHHTSVEQMQWVNFNRETVQLITLRK